MIAATLPMPPKTKPVVYPDSDGEPLAESTLQFQWIATIQGNIDFEFKDRPDVLVAGNNLIYPVEGMNTIRAAPDIYVAFGRPKGHRGSYKVWAEDNIFPQVVFEILSPGNWSEEMNRKFDFYEEYGAEEYYLYDPQKDVFRAWLRKKNILVQLRDFNKVVSPRLGIRFDLRYGPLEIYRLDGSKFQTFVELGRGNELLEIELKKATETLNAARREVESTIEKCEAVRTQSESELDRLRRILIANGLDPDAMN